LVRETVSDATRIGVVHMHSDYSHDGLDSLERLREFALERGIAFVGLTDHAEDLTPERFEQYVAHCRRLSDDRVQLIPGLEYRFAGFTGLHLLALGLAHWIAPRTPEEFVDAAREAARFTIVAHPVLARYRIPAEVAAGIDAVEIWNASYNLRYLPDVRAIRLLHALRRMRPDLVGTAGLDQHDSRNDRGTRVVVRGGGDPLAALKAGRFTNVGGFIRLDPAVSLGAVRLGVLTVLRWMLDAVERVQHHTVMFLRRRGMA